MTTYVTEIIRIAENQALDLGPDDQVHVIGMSGGIGHATRVQLLILRAIPSKPSTPPQGPSGVSRKTRV